MQRQVQLRPGRALTWQDPELTPQFRSECPLDLTAADLPASAREGLRRDRRHLDALLFLPSPLLARPVWSGRVGSSAPLPLVLGSLGLESSRLVSATTTNPKKAECGLRGAVGFGRQCQAGSTEPLPLPLATCSPAVTAVWLLSRWSRLHLIHAAALTAFVPRPSVSLERSRVAGLRALTQPHRPPSKGFPPRPLPPAHENVTAAHVNTEATGPVHRQTRWEAGCPCRLQAHELGSASCLQRSFASEMAAPRRRHRGAVPHSRHTQ